MDEAVLLNLLAETQVLNALHIAEAVRAKVDVIAGLLKRIETRELENPLRDYIAENAWLLGPEWETFKKETSVLNLVKEAAAEAGLDKDDDWKKRIDLVLSSGKQLLVVEFMRPGLTIDRNHIDRYQLYVDILRERIDANTGSNFRDVAGLLVADKLHRGSGMKAILTRLAREDMKALEWGALLGRAVSEWQDFLDILVARRAGRRAIETIETVHDKRTRGS